jgi:lipoprotein NlpD|tara:strand:+ start:522 stop:1355 length:834 start_codon:yes stop_codon:yes gene_type:complete
MKRLFIVLMLTLTACSGNNALAPVGREDSGRYQQRPAPTPAPNSYTVRKGDTLYSISFRYGMDYRDVARINGIRPPYTIYVGQKIKFDGKPVTTASTTRPGTVKPSPGRSSSPSVTRPSTTTQPSRPSTATQTPQVKPSTPKPTSSPALTSGSESLIWRWPTEGRVVSTFSESAAGRKGINIIGKPGQPILAAADGKVVYSGDGLPRYGNLLIIKHNDVYLSAYAHNDTLLVKEGDTVKSGQRIATLGRSGTQVEQLHFEIRRNGKPVDPIRFLPKQ